MSPLADKLAELKNDIEQIARDCGRESRDVKLVAVSKTQPPELIARAFAAGQVDFGENYAQEFHQKKTALAHLPLRWHFIGHLQRNKVKLVCEPGVMLHTLDRPELAAAVSAQCQKNNFVMDCLIEVKLSADPNKSGCPVGQLEDLACETNKHPGIRLVGLMTIGSQNQDQKFIANEFARLKELRDELNLSGKLKSHLSELSMGMSGDYGLAIQNGATIIRVGTKIFGERHAA